MKCRFPISCCLFRFFREHSKPPPQLSLHKQLLIKTIQAQAWCTSIYLKTYLQWPCMWEMKSPGWHPSRCCCAGKHHELPQTCEDPCRMDASHLKGREQWTVILLKALPCLHGGRNSAWMYSSKLVYWTHNWEIDKALQYQLTRAHISVVMIRTWGRLGNMWQVWQSDAQSELSSVHGSLQVKLLCFWQTIASGHADSLPEFE